MPDCEIRQSSHTKLVDHLRGRRRPAPPCPGQMPRMPSCSPPPFVAPPVSTIRCGRRRLRPKPAEGDRRHRRAPRLCPATPLAAAAEGGKRGRRSSGAAGGGPTRRGAAARGAWVRSGQLLFAPSCSSFTCHVTSRSIIRSAKVVVVRSLPRGGCLFVYVPSQWMQICAHPSVSSSSCFYTTRGPLFAVTGILLNF
jgi:hypothetical protein